jgi:hypothetical protein
MKIWSILEQILLFLPFGNLYALSKLNQDGQERTKQNGFRVTEGKKYADPEL